MNTVQDMVLTEYGQSIGKTVSKMGEHTFGEGLYISFTDGTVMFLEVASSYGMVRR